VSDTSARRSTSSRSDREMLLTLLEGLKPGEIGGRLARPWKSVEPGKSRALKQDDRAREKAVTKLAPTPLVLGETSALPGGS
jgi:DNA-directed RNA polymerase specialized sigma24 family protein